MNDWDTCTQCKRKVWRTIKGKCEECLGIVSPFSREVRPEPGRDTHFEGFAKLLFNELLEHELEHATRVFTPDEVEQVMKEMQEKSIKIIARRAYDLMEHIMLYAPVSPVPDMTEWPENPM